MWITLEYWFNKALEKALLWLAGGMLLVGLFGGPGVLAFQVFDYLRSGEWPAMSINHLVVEFGGSMEQWAISPEQWLGLHEVFESFPLSVFLFVFGLLSAIFLFLAYSKYETSNAKLFNN